jgi:hypothetical protein
MRDSIKKDPNIYPELKNDKHYETWIASVQAYANLHVTTNVLDANYKPETIWDVQAFEDQQAFMWSVAITKINTPSGHTPLRNHPGNAQKVFQLLYHELRQSLKAEYSADDLRQKLEKSDLITWTGTYVSLIEQWDQNIHMYDELTAIKGADTGIIPLTDGEKKRMLKRELESSAVMKNLTTDENFQKAFGHGNWSYSIYHNLVMTTAIEDD